tara:strand:- start:1896 stop:4925 length:3030 start_codon:yes stop_codon:yes gene_type:complete
MPKQTYIINEFHGGVNSNADPRDIDKSESPDISASIDNFGKIRTVGGFDKGDASNNATTAIDDKHGLFVMGSDTQIDNSAADETLIFHYDFGTRIDVYDSDGWHEGEIITASNAKPVYFSADGILRVGDANLGGLTRWYGHISRTVFDGLTADTVINDWVDSNAYPATPSAGKCLISTPFKANDTSGVNSSTAEYISTGGGAVMEASALNLRVGLSGITSVKTSGDAITAASDANKLPNEGTNLFTDYKNYGGGSSDTYLNTEDVYPLFLDNNINIGATPNTTRTADGGVDDDIYNSINIDTSSASNLSYTVSEEKSVAVGVYLAEAELIKVDYIYIDLGTDSSNYRRWQVPVGKCTIGWNVIVCEQGMHTLETGTPPAYGATHAYINIYIRQLSGNVGNDVPRVYISGPVVIDKVGSVGFTEGTYSFGYSWLYDDEKQESIIYKLEDLDTGTIPHELNQITIIGAPILFNFDIYLTPHPTTDYTLNERIIGSRIYYKKTSDDNHYLIGELNFVDKGFKFFPESETYDYNIVAPTNIMSPLSVLTQAITPASANVVDTWKSLNGFYQKVDTLEAAWKTGTVQGRKAYIGNVKQDGVTYPDRMLKSMVNRFDSFPNKESIVDVAVRDGENIVKLESFADRVLQFKEKTLYIINVAQGSEFLESVHPFMGINYEYHSVKTERGIAFFNEYGAYLYNGNEIIDLLEKNGKVLISEDTWRDFITEGSIAESSIGYAPKKHQIIFMERLGDVYFYNLKTGAWTTCQDMLDYNDANPAAMTNFALNGDNDMFFIGGTKSQIYKYDHTPSPTHDFNYVTRDIDFGDPSVRKKVYKVYITYKTGASNLPNIVCKFDINGAGAYDKLFASSTNYSEYVTGETGAYYSLAPATNWTTVELKPATSSEANNIYSFALSVSTGSVHSGTLASAASTTVITLDSGASAVDDFYNNMTFTTWSGLRKGETVRVTDYVGSTKVATVSPAFSGTVDNTTKFIVGLVPSSFQINDITIVYRIKSVK